MYFRNFSTLTIIFKLYLNNNKKRFNQCTKPPSCFSSGAFRSVKHSKCCSPLQEKLARIRVVWLTPEIYSVILSLYNLPSNDGCDELILICQCHCLQPSLPIKHEAFSQCFFNVGPTSKTMDQHWNNIWVDASPRLQGQVSVSAETWQQWRHSIHRNLCRAACRSVCRPLGNIMADCYRFDVLVAIHD